MKLPFLNQRGFAQFFVLLILLAGILGGSYLVQQKTNLFPKAAENKKVCAKVELTGNVEIVSRQGCQKASEILEGRFLCSNSTNYISTKDISGVLSKCENINYFKQKAQKYCENLGKSSCLANASPSPSLLSPSPSPSTQNESSVVGTQKVCEVDPKTGKRNVCSCIPNESKSKLTVIIKKDGIYDIQDLATSINSYLTSVKKSLKIENIGVSKFAGNSVSELDNFIEDVYLNQNVAYVVLVGDDLPVAQVTTESLENLYSISDQLQFVDRDYHAENNCRDLGISLILPPQNYTNSAKPPFVKEVINKYASYHNNPLYYKNMFEQGVLRIMHDPNYPQIGAPLPLELWNSYYNLPTTEIYNSDHQKVELELKEKYLISKFDVHGQIDSVGLGLNSQNLAQGEYYAFYTTPDDILKFYNQNETPSLFIDSGACQATNIKGVNSVVDNPDKPPVAFCCWPQLFLKLGVWSYYSISNGKEDIQKDLTSGMPMGYLTRKINNSFNLIFGDIMAFYPN